LFDADLLLDEMKLHFDKGVTAALYDALDLLISVGEL